MSDEIKGDAFDQVRTRFDGLPGVVMTRPTTVEAVPFMLGPTETYIVQTIKHDGGETVLLQILGSARSLRLVLPPKVTQAIARQSSAASSTLRSQNGKRIAADRKARGIEPGFKKYKKG